MDQTRDAPKLCGTEENIAADQSLATRRKIQMYFEHKYEIEVDRVRRLRLSTRRRKYTLGIAGALFFIACFAVAVLGYWGYQPLVSFKLAAAIGSVVGVVMIIWALAIDSVEEMDSLLELENEIDNCLKNDARRALAQASRQHIPAVGPSKEFDAALVGYPDKTFCADIGTAIKSRIGKDLRARFTPVKIVAYKFEPATLLMFEAHLDISTGETLAERWFESGYNNILAFERRCQAAVRTDDGERRPGKLFSRGRRQRSPRNALRDQDSLEILFEGSKKVEIVLRDASRVDSPGEEDARTLGDLDDITAFWEPLRAKWLQKVAATNSRT